MDEMRDSDEFDEVQAAARAADAGPERSLWDSDEAISSLREERIITNESSEKMARRLLEQAAPLAAGRIIHLAMHSSNDNTSLAASRYITDKLYEDQTGAATSTWEKMLARAVSDVELHANAGAE